MMSGTSAPIRLSLPDNSLHVEFRWRGDRFVHEFVLADGSRVGSIEGDADQVWPPSPPVQQLSRELIGQSYVIMGVGAAGRSHWSLSVEINDEAESPALKFDFACRSKSTPQWLGSSYQNADALRIVASSGSTTTACERKIAVQPSGGNADETIRWGYCVSAK